MALRDDPPTIKPFIPDILVKSLTLLEFTDPPYKILIFFIIFSDFKTFLIKFIFLVNSKFFGTIPVPIDDTGSYATIIF